MDPHPGESAHTQMEGSMSRQSQQVLSPEMEAERSAVAARLQEERAAAAAMAKAAWAKGGSKPHKPRVQPKKKGLKVWEVMVAIPVGYLAFLGMSELVARFVK